MKEILENRRIRVYLRRGEKRSNKVVCLRGYKGGGNGRRFWIERSLLLVLFFLFFFLLWLFLGMDEVLRIG